MNDKKLEIVLAAKDMTHRAFKSFQNRMTTLTKSVFSFHGALAGAAALASMGYFINRTLQCVDALDKQAKKLGIGAEALQEFRFAASQTGVEQKTLDMAMQRFTRRIGEAAEGGGELKGVLDKYNIAVRDAEGRTRRAEDVFKDLADVVRNTESGAERLRIAFKMFDSEGAALVNLLREGSDGFRNYQKEARELGIVLDSRLVEASARANDELDKLGKVIGVHITSAVASLGPNIADLVEDINGWVKENQYLINQKLPEYFEDVKDALAGVFKFFADPADSFKKFLDRWDNLGEKILKATRYIEDLDRRMKGLPPMSAIFGGGRGGAGAGGSFTLSDEMDRALQTALGGFGTPPLTGTGGTGEAGGTLDKIEKNYIGFVQRVLEYERQKAQEIGELALLEYGYKEDAWQKTLDARAAYEAQCWEGIQAGYWAEYNLMKDVEAGVKESWESIEEKAKDACNAMIEFSQRTAEAMEQNFSDLFFDVMTGEFDSLRDYALGALRSIERAIADILGQMAKQAIFGSWGGFGGVKGWAEGGLLTEPVLGRGIRSGDLYTFAERGPEYIFPQGRGRAGQVVNQEFSINIPFTIAGEVPASRAVELKEVVEDAVLRKIREWM